MKNKNLFMAVTLLANFGYMSANSEEGQVETISTTDNTESTPTNLNDCAEQLNLLIENLKNLSAEEKTTTLAAFYDRCNSSIPDLKTTLDALQAEHSEQTLEKAPKTDASLSDKQ